MLYAAALVNIALLYLRPSDIIPALENVPLVLLASVLTAPALGLAIINDPPRFLGLPNDKYLIGLWAAIPLSCLGQGWFSGAFRGIGQFGQVVFLYMLVRYAVTTERQFRGVVLLLIALVSAQAMSGLMQWYTGVGLGGVTVFDHHGMFRIRGAGIFNDPNDLAMVLVTVVPFLVLIATDGSTGLIRRLAAAALLVPILAALYFTNSRGGMLALGACIVTLAYQRLGWMAATYVTVLALMAIVAFGPSRLEQMQTDEVSAQLRIEAWSEALQLFKSQPLVGVGWSRFTDYHWMVAHNSFIHVLAELGIVGGFFFVGVIYWYFRSLLVARIDTSGAAAGSDWAGALIASGVGMFTAAAFLSRQYNPAVYTVLAVGAAYAGLRETGVRLAERPPGASIFDTAIIAGLEIACIAVIYAIVVAFGIWVAG